MSTETEKFLFWYMQKMLIENEFPSDIRGERKDDIRGERKDDIRGERKDGSESLTMCLKEKFLKHTPEKRQTLLQDYDRRYACSKC